jgi:putative glycosyltransferase (TIGR04372 family)
MLIRALRPFVLVRMGSLNSGRIGHFVADGAEHVARIKQQSTNTVDWFWLGKICNTQWELMIRRTLPVHSFVKYLDWWNRTIPGGSIHMRPSSYTQSRDVEGLYARYDVKIPFLPAESEEALAWLRSKGWSDGEPFVCLLVRDAEFLANDQMYGTARQRARLDWSYHDYRDSDIDTYLPAIQWLAEQGVWVVRMGKLMAKPLPAGMDHVIDYAFDAGKSDLLDIWLFANCTGCMTTSSGPDVVSVIYGKPLLFVNALPLGLSLSWGRSIWVPKPLRWAATERALSASEHLSNSWLTATEYETAGIAIVNLSSDEITAAVQEFWQRSSGSWKEAEEDQLRQVTYRNTFLKWPEFSTYNGWLHPDARVGTAWLRSYM